MQGEQGTVWLSGLWTRCRKVDICKARFLSLWTHSSHSAPRCPAAGVMATAKQRPHTVCLQRPRDRVRQRVCYFFFFPSSVSCLCAQQDADTLCLPLCRHLLSHPTLLPTPELPSIEKGSSDTPVPYSWFFHPRTLNVPSRAESTTWICTGKAQLTGAQKHLDQNEHVCLFQRKKIHI